MDIQVLKRVVCESITTHTDELTCSECFELLDKYAETALAGHDAAHLLPHVHDHLERCTDCREEWTGLLAALKAVSGGSPGLPSTDPSRGQHSTFNKQEREIRHA